MVKMMNKILRVTGVCMRNLGAVALAAAIFVAGASDAFAQKKKLSDKAVKLMMRYTWAIMPAKIKTGDGKEIVIDKKNPGKIKVSMDDARRIIRVGRLSAFAQICGLRDQQTNNYRTMMKQEQASKKWSTEQLIYINQLHLFTVMFMTGNVSVSEKGKDAKVRAAEAAKKKKKQTCTKEQAANIKKQIETYVKTAQK